MRRTVGSHKFLRGLLVAWAVVAALAPAARGQETLWTRQFGSAATDYGIGISVDASGVYVAGFTEGTLPGQTSAGGTDAFVRKYDLVGTEVWTRQFGTAAEDFAIGISVDSSGVYVAGATRGTLPGQTSAGFMDVFVRKYDAAGTEVWTRQFGTANPDQSMEISAGTSGVYVVGSMGGAAGGTLPGQTSAGGQDAFVRKYDAAGTEVWTRQFGSAGHELATGISADASGIYVSGQTTGTFPGQTSAGGSDDAFVRKYDAAGTEVWTLQFGTAGFDDAFGISADASGVYVTGSTEGTLPGQTSAGGFDGYVRKFACRCAITVDLTGEFDFRLREAVRITVTALVLDAETLEPISGPTVTIRIFDSAGALLISAPMVEVLPGTGIFQWTSTGTLRDLGLPKGIYLAVVEASYSTGPVAQAILEFHVDPPGESIGATGFSFVDMAFAVAATAGITALVLRRREVAHTLRRLRKRP